LSGIAPVGSSAMIIFLGPRLGRAILTRYPLAIDSCEAFKFYAVTKPSLKGIQLPGFALAFADLGKTSSAAYNVFPAPCCCLTD